MSKMMKIMIGVAVAFVVILGGTVGGYFWFKAQVEGDARHMIDQKLALYGDHVSVTYGDFDVSLFDEVITMHNLIVHDKDKAMRPVPIASVQLSELRQGALGIEKGRIAIRGIKLAILDQVRDHNAAVAKETGQIGLKADQPENMFIGMGYQIITADMDMFFEYNPEAQTTQTQSSIQFHGIGGWGFDLTLGGIKPELAQLISGASENALKMENAEQQMPMLLLGLAGQVMTLAKDITLNSFSMSLNDAGIGDRLTRGGLEADYDVTSPEAMRKQGAVKVTTELRQKLMAAEVPEVIIKAVEPAVAGFVETGGKITLRAGLTEPVALFSEKPGPMGPAPNPAFSDPEAIFKALGLSVVHEAP